jgi:hypothetical protein
MTIALYSGVLAAGSYPYSQAYKFNVGSDSLIKVISKFKEKNPSYNTPLKTGLVDSIDNNGTFYNCWIYYRQQNKIAFFVVLGDIDDKEKSSIWFVGVNNGLILGQWKRINEDFDRTDNRRAKKDFEEEFLKKLKLQYKDDGNSMFVFWK